MQYAEVMVDATTARGSFTYGIPAKFLSDVRKGALVRVPFRTKEVDGIIVGLSRTLPKSLERGGLRQIVGVVERRNILPPSLFELAEWMSHYYLCSIGQALFTMLPPFPKRPSTIEIDVEDTHRDKASYLFIDGPEKERWSRYTAALQKTVARGQRGLVIFPDRTRVARFERKLKEYPWKIALFGADLPLAKRFRLWEKIRAGVFDVIIGTRSAVFTPAGRLGLIILDEESHPAHKEDQQPRYHARDIVLKRGVLEGAKVLLGNRLPTLATFVGIRRGFLRRIELPQQSVPTTLIDQRYTHDLIDPGVEEAIGRHGRAIILVNRLGVGAAARCQDCDFRWVCPNCTLPLTVHRNNALVCHHCGHRAGLPASCPRCKSTKLKSTGQGTERLESYLAARFPQLKIERLEAGRSLSPNADLIVATVKLLDTSLEAPVVIGLGLDNILELPDPLAVERAARLAVQLRSRASHTFFIQTRLPDHRVWKVLTDEDAFLEEELQDRSVHGYPPYVSLVRLVQTDDDLSKIKRNLNALAENLKSKLSPREAQIFGPGPCFYERLKGRWRYHLLVKVRDQKAKAKIRSLLTAGVTVDVNPIELL